MSRRNLRDLPILTRLKVKNDAARLDERNDASFYFALLL